MTSDCTPSPSSQHIFRESLFSDQVVAITGGGSGIGLCTAIEFAKLGAKVAICGRTAEKLETARNEIATHSRLERTFAQTCDIREANQVDAFVDATIETLGHIDILFNNAGGQFPAPAQNISPNGFAAVVKNNLCGTFNMTAVVANKSMIPNKRGCIVNMIANIYRGFPGMAHTGAARAGVENLTMSLSVEWARFNIKVNAIAPGIITSSGTARYPKEILEMAIAGCPAKRPGTIDEVAASILFLASPAAQYITGTTLRVDGGHALRGDPFPI
ncbi:MAG: SDR family oxidoreductase [Myxococcales bacterium]|nr:SDR family oxidoreductase [Myxococcales bacterium]